MLVFDEHSLMLKYISRGNIYELQFGETFKLNNSTVNLDYPRYDSPYSKAEKKDNTITYSFNGKTLHLDFENMIREF